MAEGSEPPYFMNTCPIFFATPPFKFCLPSSLHLPCCLQSPPPLLILLPCFFDWMGDRATFDVPFSLMISWMYTCRALRPWCMFYAARRQVYWGLTCGFLLVHWFDITHSQTHTCKDTQHTQGPVYWHTHINVIYTNFHVLIIAIFIALNEEFTYIKHLLPTLSSFQKLFSCKSRIFWLDAIRLWNTLKHK